MTSGLRNAGLTNVGVTKLGLTNHATGGDPSFPERSTAAADTAAADLNVFPNADSWRVEVAARLERYRTRRKPRTPRYPSLLLPFDAPESWSHPAPPTALVGGSCGDGRLARPAERSSAAPSVHEPRATEQDFACQAKQELVADGMPRLAERRQTEQEPDFYPESAKVIEFPRSAAIPVFCRSELADPVFDHDRPRIVEAPEILPPPPALGGMLIEPAQQEPADRRAGADLQLPSPYRSASITRRAYAAFVDGVVLLAALAAFAAISLRVNPTLNLGLNLRLNPGLNLMREPFPMLAAALGLVTLLLWMAYQFLFVVYTGSTPGLRAARLRLAGFDGLPLHRRSRRWRVLASFLSAFSAGLGYFWCVLDQDGLCWHDRISRTYVQSIPRE